ncbi:MAG: TonB family protein [Ramlibacter sp.]|nr:TonB family protein [Ramlibacter sp.]
MFARPHFGLVLTVALAHGAALWAMGQPSAHVGHGQADGSSRVMHVRQVPAATPPALLAITPQARAEAAPELQMRPSFTVLDRALQVAQAAAAPPVQGLATSAETDESAFADYLPRSKLSAPPQPQDMVEVPFPADVSGIVDLKVRIALFIDELGTVRRIRIDSPDVPSPFVVAVLDSFSAVRFNPGKLDGMAVRSQIRLEVEFNADNRPR